MAGSGHIWHSEEMKGTSTEMCTLKIV